MQVGVFVTLSFLPCNCRQSSGEDGGVQQMSADQLHCGPSAVHSKWSAEQQKWEVCLGIVIVGLVMWLVVKG